MRMETRYPPSFSAAGPSCPATTASLIDICWRPGASSWVYIFRLDDGRVRTYDQFNDTGLAEAFA